VIARLREAFPDLPDEVDARTVFLKLRECATRGDARIRTNKRHSMRIEVICTGDEVLTGKTINTTSP